MLTDSHDQLKTAPSTLVQRLRRTSLTARFACLFFLGFSLPVTYCFTFLSGYDGTGWVRMTAPMFDAQHWLLGFAAVYQDNLVIYHENAPYLTDISMLSGGLFNPNPLMSVRGLYAFLGAFLAPFCGSIKALVLVNYLYWALAAYVAWRFTLKLFGDERAALLAVLFVTGGIGWLSNLSDLSPHVASYAWYFLVTLVLYESGVWRERRPLRTHLLLGVLLALARLNYENGLLLIFFYALIALRRNQLLHVLSGILIGFSSVYIWGLHLNLYGAYYFADYQWLDFLHNTQNALQPGFDFVRDNLNQPAVILGRYAHDFVQLLVALEALPLIILGLLSWWALRRNWALCWFFAVGFLLQVVAIVPQASWPTARGAYVYGASLFLIAPASYSLARLLKMHGAARWAGLLVLVCMLTYHFCWGAAQFWGNTAPLGVYAATVLENIVRDPQHALLSTEQPIALSLTGAEPTPYLYWGRAGIIEAGALPAETAPEWAVNWKANSRRRLILRAWQIRLPLLCYFTALLLLLRPYAQQSTFWRRWLPQRITTVLLIWLLFWFGAAALAALSQQAFGQVFWGGVHQITIAPGATIKYSLQVSDIFLQQLEQQLTRDALLEGFTSVEPGGGSFQFRLVSGGVPLLEKESNPPLRNFPIPVTDESGRSFLETLKQHKELTIEYTNRGSKDLVLTTWQRASLPGRKLAATPPLDAQSARSLPAFELRVRPHQRENRTIYLLGF